MGVSGSETRRVLRDIACAATAVAMLAAPGEARAYTKTFSANSLVIPTQQEYQTDCGMVSAYGLIYTILYKNSARLAAGQKPITIYWVIEPRKLSHHRCDTGTDTLPDYSQYNDNDGCDFAVQSATGQPVALLTTSNAEQAPFNVWTTTYSASSGQIARSGSQNQTIDASKHVVKYSGGLWVIDATDRAAVLNLLATEPLLAKYRDGGTCTSLPVASGASHNLNIHSARIGFTAPVARMMNAKPPLIALLAGQYVGILQSYLVNAGLDDIPSAGGNVTSHGVIYDVLAPLTDFISTTANPLGALSMPDPGNSSTNLYQVMWAPHWEETTDTVAGPADCADADDVCGDGVWTHNGDTYKTNAFKNIATFADNGFGVFLECASIASFEGSYLMGQSPCSNTYQCTCQDPAGTTCSPFGSTVPQTCPSGSSSTCGLCYGTCPSGTTLKTSPCDQIRCVNTATPCPGGSTFRSSDLSCWSCDTANGWSLVTPLPTAAAPQCRKGSNFQNANSVTPNGSVPTSVAGTCPGGYTTTCQASTAAIELPGWDPVRFQMTNRILKNGLSGGSYGGSFPIPDCTDQNVVGTKYQHAAITGDCFDYHPTSGGPGNMFSQKGDSNFTGATGHTSHWEPAAPVGSMYRTATLQFATSYNSTNASRTGWDFITARHKDNDPAKGMIVYLGGHTFSSDAGGNRIVLNTMLNLGFSISGTELARSEPVGYATWGKDTNGAPIVAAKTVFQGTYMQRDPPGPYQEWINYNPTAAGSWRFPYIDGHLRAYDLASISTVTQDFKTGAMWDSAGLVPAPGSRNLFTVVGGNANLSWTKIPWDYTQTSPSTCAAPSGVRDANSQPVCDLSLKLSSCATAGITTQQLLAGDASGTKAGTLGMFVQQVRGWCAAHDKTTGAAILQPAVSQCDNPTSKWQRNVAFLGGVDHSSPAIVGPSAYIGDKTAADGTVTRWSQRPAVAYFGSRDGMLHAVYVSGDTSFTAGGATLPAGVKAGQELWAFLPPGQLCGLATNSAMVDASVNVMDVFGNFPRDVNGDGVFDLSAGSLERPNGIREWRTILVATAGEGAAEIFALDVTNPLKPVLLWEVSGASNLDDRFDMNGNGTFADTGDHMDKAKPQSFASKWFNSDDGTQGTHPWIPTDYLSTNATVLDGIKFGRYDYHNLGYASGTAIGTIWNGNAFQFVAYLASNAADFTNATTPLGYRGVEVFAIDVVSGQKLWQWENRYTRQNAAGNVIADNGIPGRPALVDADADGSVDRVYVGDLEGHVWELSATTGRNLNWLPSTQGGFKSFPLWGTRAMTSTGVDAATAAAFTPSGGSGLAQQPLTSPIGVGRFTAVPAGKEPYLQNRIAIAQGTMGVDWSIASTQPGHVYALPAFPDANTRIDSPVSPSAKTVDPLLSGVVLEAAIWDTPLDLGERLFGMPKIVGNDLLANTSYGSFSGDITSSITDQGRSIKVNASGMTTIDTGQKRFGGVLVFGTDLVSTSETGIVRKPNSTTTPGVGNRVLDRFTPVTTKAWEIRPDNAPSFVQ